VSTLKFEIATADKEAAKNDDVWHLKVFEIEGEQFAAVRPAEGAWLVLMRHVYVAKQDETQMGIAGIKFLDQCFVEEDLRTALEEAGYDDDQVELLATSNQRINDRLMDRHDPFGYRTLIAVMEGLTEEWSGNPTGSPSGSSRSQRRTGAKSTAARSSTASTSKKSSTRARRVS
jgi:hypothetical protein